MLGATSAVQTHEYWRGMAGNMQYTGIVLRPPPRKLVQQNTNPRNAQRQPCRPPNGARSSANPH
eukprot:5753476-Lingulodinium_polyedra.AAC.1